MMPCVTLPQDELNYTLLFFFSTFNMYDIKCHFLSDKSLKMASANEMQNQVICVEFI